ncbi:MAG: hypothetical protein NC541_14765 [bacterium]|nr:hypothetical protein [bacterium]
MVSDGAVPQQISQVFLAPDAVIDTEQFLMRLCHPDVKGTIQGLSKKTGDLKFVRFKGAAYNRFVFPCCAEVRLAEIRQNLIKLIHDTPSFLLYSVMAVTCKGIIAE